MIDRQDRPGRLPAMIRVLGVPLLGLAALLIIAAVLRPEMMMAAVDMMREAMTGMMGGH